MYMYLAMTMSATIACEGQALSGTWGIVGWYSSCMGRNIGVNINVHVFSNDHVSHSSL